MTHYACNVLLIKLTIATLSDFKFGVGVIVSVSRREKPLNRAPTPRLGLTTTIDSVIDSLTLALTPA